MPVWLKWILVLPVSFATMAAVRLLYRIIIGSFLATESETVMIFDELLITVLATVAYLSIGIRLAPGRKLATALGMSLAYVVVLGLAVNSAIAHGGQGASAYNFLGVAGAVVTCAVYFFALRRKTAGRR